MMQTRQAWYGELTSALKQVSNASRAAKLHDFSRQSPDTFVFEQIGESQAYMTGQGKNIQQGDQLLLQLEQHPALYQVQHIDYYAAPSDIWTALLFTVNSGR